MEARGRRLGIDVILRVDFKPHIFYVLFVAQIFWLVNTRSLIELRTYDGEGGHFLLNIINIPAGILAIRGRQNEGLWGR